MSSTEDLPTEKQLNYLAKMANWTSDVNTSPKTKREASDEIDKNVKAMRQAINDELDGAMGDLMW